MKKMASSSGAVLLLFLLFLFFLLPPTALALGNRNLEVTARYLKGIVERSDYQSMLDWPILALAGLGEDVEPLINRREAQVRQGQLFDAVKNTDYQRTLVAVAAAGKDPRDFGQKNLVKDIKGSQLSSGKFANTVDGRGETLVNAHIWGIISLYSAGETIPNREMALRWLEQQQNGDGGFSIDINVSISDVDMTGMALMAFAALGKDKQYPAVIKALDYLQSQQALDGGFIGWGGSGSESIAQVIQGLMMLGIDPTGPAWTKRGGNPVNALERYRLGDGSYSKEPGGKSDTMSTYQALIALGDYYRGESIYRVLRRRNISFPDVSASHFAIGAIRDLAARGIMEGFPGGIFRPSDPVTRAQFATLLVRVMEKEHLVGPVTLRFGDLNREHWANAYIRVAVDAGLIQGLGGEPPRFAPDATISGSQAATLLVRALGKEQQALQRGGDHWYTGYVSVAREQGILYPYFGEELPVTRAQTAWSLQRYMQVAGK
ncbi:MAG: S-layer homology domain-containing protein [Bacillota bacterium]